MKRTSDLLRSSLPILVFILVWAIAVKQEVLPSTLVASPDEVVFRFFQLAFDGELFGHVFVSLSRILYGFLIGVFLGIFGGVIIGASRYIAVFFESFILVLMPIPPIAWIPLLIIILGIDEGSKIALIAIGCFFTMFISTTYGIRSAERKLVEVAQVLEKGRLGIIFGVLLPSAIPGVLASMRIAMGLSWTLLMASEIIASSQGLGWLMWNARNFSRPDDMLVGMVMVGIMGKLTDLSLVALERYLTRWRPSYRDIGDV